MNFSFDTANLCFLDVEKNESIHKEGILPTPVKTVPDLSYLQLFQTPPDC